MGKDENKVNKENNTFSYTYSAKQQEEIQNIRKKYVSKEEDKMEKLRRLDSAVYKKSYGSVTYSWCYWCADYGDRNEPCDDRFW